MNFNRNEHSRFVRWLDRTAERNPVLWLPCIVLLVIAIGVEWVGNTVKTAFSRRERACTFGGKVTAQFERKPFVLRSIALMITFAFTFTLNPDIFATFGITVYADEGTVSVEMSNNEYEWHEGWNWGKSATSIDYLDFNSNYFVRIDNNDYSDQSVDKKVSVKPNTKYRLSAMVKVDNFAMNPQEAENPSGASVGISWTFEHSEFLRDNEWTYLEYCFDTKNDTEVTLALRYGMFGSTCKGTAWFTNIKLEEYTQPQYSSTNIGYHDYINAYRWARPVYSYLTEQSEGTLERLEYISDEVVVEKYLKNGANTIDAKIIKMELPLFGAFYSGNTYNYIAYGQNNHEHNDSVEVIRIVKYTKDWNRIDSFSIYGANTNDLFGGGTPRLDEEGDKLLLHACHGMYNGHQANMTYIIDTTTKDNYYIGHGYTSHSFSQFLRAENGTMYRVDHGDAYPRSVILTKYPVDMVDADTNYSITHILEICGDTGNNDTGVSVGGFELSDYGFIIVGNTVDQSNSATYDAWGQRNIFISAINSNMDYAPPIFLTNYSSGVKVGNPYVVKINGNRFAVMWEETVNGKTVVKYLTVDSRGNIITPTVSISARLSDCQPIVVDGNHIMWYYTNNWSPTFVTVDFDGNVYTGHNVASEYTANGVGHWHSCYDCTGKFDYAEHIVNIPKATATEAQKCVICNYVIEASPNTPCTHNYGTSWSYNPSSHWYECTLCHAKADEAAHIPNIPVATPTQDKICIVCNYVMERYTNNPCTHNYNSVWKYDVLSHWHECTLCGAKADEAAHISNIPAATPTRDKVCTVCNYVMEHYSNNPCTHNYGTAWKCDVLSHWHECTLCGAKADEAAHIPNIPAATAAQDKVCTICGYVIERATGTHIHDYGLVWKYDNLSHWHECILCGEKLYFENHISNSGIVTVQPTAYSSGTRTYSCRVCGYVMRTETIAPTGEYNPSYIPPYNPPSYVKPSNSRIPEPIVKPEDIEKYPVLEDEIITEDITVKVKSKLKDLSGGGTHIESKKKYFSSSAIVLLSNTENAKKSAAMAVESINGGEEHNIIYPFDISVYNSLTNEKMSLRNDGYITFEVAVPKSMVKYADSIKVYHIDGSNPELLMSSIVVKNNTTKVRFTAKDFSPYMFTAYSEEEIENIESGAGIAENSAPVDTAAPVTNGVGSPVFRLPHIADCSNKKRRYRILRKRKLDDLVFVF